MVRRIAKTIGVVAAVLVVVAIVAAVVVWQTRGPALARKFGQLAQEYLVANDSTRIEISDVSGNPLGSLRLHGVRLMVRDGKEWKRFLSSSAVDLEFDVSKMSRAGVEFRSVRVSEPQFRLLRGRDGGFLLPHFGKKGRKGGPKFHVRIDDLSVEDGDFSIERGGEDVVFSRINVSTLLRRTDEGIVLDSLRASFELQPWEYRVEGLSGGLVVRGDAVRTDSLAVRTPASSFVVRGLYPYKEADSLNLEFLSERFSIPELRAFESLSFLPDSGQVAGEARVEKEGSGPTRVLTKLQGQYGRHPIKSLDATTELGKGQWRSEFRLLSAGSTVEGSFASGPGTLQECAVDFRNFDPGEWQEIFGQKELPHGSLDGAFRFSGSSLTSPAREGPFEVALDPGHYAGFAFSSARASGSFDGHGRLLLPAVRFSGNGYEATASGSVELGGAIDFNFESSVSGLTDFSWVTGRFDLTGNVSATGRLSSDGNRMVLNARLAGPLGGTVPRSVSGLIKEGRVAGEVWPSLSLDTEALLSPAAVLGYELDSLRVRAVVTEPGPAPAGTVLSSGEDCSDVKAVIASGVQAARADSLLDVEASVIVCEGETLVKATRLVLDTGRSTWTSDKHFSLVWRERRLGVRDFELSSVDGRFAFDGTYEPETGGVAGEVELSLEEVSAVLAGYLPFGGRLDGRATFELDREAARVEAEVDWEEASVSGRRLGNVSFGFGSKGDEISIGKLRLTERTGAVEASGRLVVAGGLRALADTLSADRAMPAGTSAELTIRLDGFELSQLRDWHDSMAVVGGSLAGTVGVTGSLENPTVELDLTGTDLRIKEYEVSRADVRARLQNGTCALSQVGLTERGARGTCEGSFPLTLNLAKGRVSVPDGPLDIRVSLPESDFSVASLFIRQIASSSGLMVGQARIGGTVKNPTLDGAFDIREATLRLAGREEVLEHLNAHVTLDETEVELVDFAAAQGEKGRIDGSGRIYLGGDNRGHYSFSLRGKRVTYGDPEDMAMVFDCDLVVASVDVKDRGTIPKITGSINVRQGIIAREFESGIGSGEEAMWFCDVQIEVPNNLWLKNINAEIELGGSLTARKDLSGLILLGTLRILRGKYYVFDNEFRIVSGSLEFKDVGRIDPELNIEAETSASGRKIFLSLSGKLSEPAIRLSCDDANLNQTDILRLLTLGKYVDASTGETTNGGFMPGVTGSVGNYFLRQIERRLAREVKWVDSIELGGSLEGGASLSELRWGLGKYITPALYFRYSQGLVRTSERDVSIEYRLSELLFLRGGVVSRDRLAGRDRDEYSLDLRLKYEY